MMVKVCITCHDKELFVCTGPSLTGDWIILDCKERFTFRYLINHKTFRDVIYRAKCPKPMVLLSLMISVLILRTNSHSYRIQHHPIQPTPRQQARPRHERSNGHNQIKQSRSKTRQGIHQPQGQENVPRSLYQPCTKLGQNQNNLRPREIKVRSLACLLSLRCRSISPWRIHS